MQLKQGSFLMSFKILSQKENILFNRNEIKASIKSEVTPSRLEVLKLISEKFSTQPENIKIQNILGKFGSKEFIINVNIYASKEDKDNTEKRTKQEIEAEKKAQQESEKPKEEVKEKLPEEITVEQPEETKPAEEIKSEINVEEKPTKEKAE